MIMAHKQKLDELKTHFADMAAEELHKLRNKVQIELEAKKNIEKQRKDYGSSVKKPKIDE